MTKQRPRIQYYAFAFLAAALFSSQAFSQAPAWQWGKSIGGTTNDYANAVAVDASGNIYTAGTFNGTTTDFDPGPGVVTLFSHGGDDFFVSKLDASGNFVWAVALGGVIHDGANGIAVDGAGNVYVTGYFVGTTDFNPNNSVVFNLTTTGNTDGIFVLKLNSVGNFIWAKAVDGTSHDRANSIVLDDSANVYTAGRCGGADFDPGPGVFNLTAFGNGMFVSKLDSAGNFVWAKALGGMGQAIAVDASGNVYTTGVFQATNDFDPGAGTFDLTAVGNYDAFVSKLDNAGNFVWAKGLGGTSLDEGYSIAADDAGNVYTTGLYWFTADFDPGAPAFNLTSPGGPDAFISKLNSSGDFVWAKTIGGTGYDEGRGITLDTANNIYITGYFNATADFDPNSGTFNLTSSGGDDIYVCRLDNAGNFVWAIQLGGTGNDVARAVALSTPGNLHIAGYYFSPAITVASNTLTNADTSLTYEDVIIAKTDIAILTGVSESASYIEGLSIYPNPTSNQFTMYDVRFRISEIEIYNTLGEKVYEQHLTSNVQRLTIDVANFDTGVYFVRVKASEGISTGKFVKE